MDTCQYNEKMKEKKVSSESDSQTKSTNQTYDMGHEIGMTPYIGNQKFFLKKMLLRKTKVDLG